MDLDPPQPKRVRLTAEERKQAIALAAIPVFARHGFSGTTTRELAASARVSEALLYRHFPSKESIHEYIQGLMCQSSDVIAEYLEALPPSTESLVKMIYLIYQIIFSLEKKHTLGDALPRLMVQSLLEDGDFARTFHETRFNRMLPLLAESAEVALAGNDLIPGPLSHEERQWFPHHLAVSLRLSHLPEKEVFDFGSPPQERFHQALWFALRGLGLKDEPLNRLLDIEKLDEEIFPVLIQAGMFEAES